MNILKTAFCRTFQAAFRTALPVLPYREPEIIDPCAELNKAEKAYADGHNHQASENMLHVACKAGIAFSKSYVGYVHAPAHSPGGKYGTPHGLANAVMMTWQNTRKRKLIRCIPCRCR